MIERISVLVQSFREPKPFFSNFRSVFSRFSRPPRGKKAEQQPRKALQPGKKTGERRVREEDGEKQGEKEHEDGQKLRADGHKLRIARCEKQIPDRAVKDIDLKRPLSDLPESSPKKLPPLKDRNQQKDTEGDRKGKRIPEKPEEPGKGPERLRHAGEAELPVPAPVKKLKIGGEERAGLKSRKEGERKPGEDAKPLLQTPPLRAELLKALHAEKISQEKEGQKGRHPVQAQQVLYPLRVIHVSEKQRKKQQENHDKAFLPPRPIERQGEDEQVPKEKGEQIPGRTGLVQKVRKAPARTIGEPLRKKDDKLIAKIEPEEGERTPEAIMPVLYDGGRKKPGEEDKGRHMKAVDPIKDAVDKSPSQVL